MRPLLIAALIAIAAVPASAASVIVDVTDANGKPLADAVVRLTPDNAPAETTVSKRESAIHTIDQRNETFIPYVEIVQAGDDVVFRNSDQTRHHVYSFSPLGLFEFVLAPGDRSPPVHLDQPGVIAVGCNIHDYMIAYLYITDSSLVAQSDSQGRAEIGNVPDGPYTAHIWHPRLRPGRGELLEKVTASSVPAKLAITLFLLPDRGRSESDRSHY